LVFNRLAALPTRNFQDSRFEAAEQLAPETLALTRERTRASCAACTIGCEHLYSVRSDSDGEAARPVRIEYENLFALGPLCGVGDSDVVLKASQRCDALGIDTISTGGTVAFAMECAERGLIDAPWLRMGDGSALLRAIESIGRRDGLGDLLAEGSRRMAESIGRGSISFAPQVKGLEIPGYEPRALQAMALGFAVGSRGADHNRSGAYEIDFSEDVDRRNPDARVAALAVETEDRAAIIDSMILCKFLRGVFEDFFADAARMLHLVTGVDFDADELRRTARRIVAAKKQFNVDCGWTPAEDTLPDRFLHEQLPSDTAAVLTRDRLDRMITAYNRHRGWTDDGWPR
jgi:aldehyde:ferredoxin oxidoreductase